MSWSFDSVDDLVVSGTEIVGQVWTVAAWIYPLSPGEVSQAFIVCHGISVPSSGRFTLQFYNSPNLFSFNLRIGRGTDGVYRTNANTWVVNQWQHVCFTYDGAVVTNDPLFYYNGQPMALTRQTAPAGTMSTDNLQVNIGNAAGSQRTFDGLIGDVCIWPRVFSAVDVANLYVMGVRLYPDYILYWPGDNTQLSGVPTSLQQFPFGGRSLTQSFGPLVTVNPPWVKPVGVRG